MSSHWDGVGDALQQLQIAQGAAQWKQRALEAEAAFAQVVATNNENAFQRNAWKRVLRRIVDNHASSLDKATLLAMFAEEKEKEYRMEDAERAKKGQPPVARKPVDPTKINI